MNKDFTSVVTRQVWNDCGGLGVSIAKNRFNLLIIIIITTTTTTTTIIFHVSMGINLMIGFVCLLVTSWRANKEMRLTNTSLTQSHGAIDQHFIKVIYK